MFPTNDASLPTSRRSGSPPAKLDLFSPLRRLTKSKREPTPSHQEEYVPRPTLITSLTTQPVTSTLHLGTLSSSTPRRVRVSGSRLPSGYRPSVDTKSTAQPLPKPPIEPQPDSAMTHRRPPPPLRTRITRLIIGHTPHAASISTPTSSTVSFPSSSRTSTSTTASIPKTVRFSPSTSFERSMSQQNPPEGQEKQPTKMSRWTKRTIMSQGRDGTTNGGL